MKPQKDPTCVAKVVDAMRSLDDFVRAKHLRAATGCNENQVSAALHSLRNYKVVECMESGGELWWYPLPPGNDTRHHVCTGRTPEEKPRKPRKKTLRGLGKVNKPDISPRSVAFRNHK